MNNYKELIVWQKAIDLAVSVYEITRKFPKEETYSLTQQLRRSAVSISSNIAEGAGRNSKKDFNNFLGISNGSACELDTQLTIATKVGLIEQGVFELMQEKITEIQKMNWSLKKSLAVS